MTWLLALIVLPGVAQAQLGRTQHIRASLVAESATPRAGAPVTLAFVMTPAAGWHGYWKNPGDAGVETQATWTLPRGVSAGPIAYPVPQTLIVAGLMNYVYEGRYAQPLMLTLPAGLAKGTRLPIRVRLDYLACTREICVPEKAELAIALTVGDGAVTPAARAAFDGFRAALPKPLGGRARFAVAGGRFRLAVPMPASVRVAEPYFFPLTDGVIDYAAPQRVSRRGDALIIETAAKGPAPRRMAGVLRIGRGKGLTLDAVPGTVPAAGVAIGAADEGDAPAGSGGAGTLLAALGGALLGGLLLNIMPCVFPILSLKALSLARGGGDERSVRREALAYAAGVILVCVALGAILLALRAGGSAAGWAFQLQDPRVIVVLMLLTAAIGFNLAGLFELPAISGGGALAGKGGTGGAFWTGALAAFVATPCTGPFMGAALGAALVLPTVAALAVFAGLGLGMAIPFLLLGYVPRVRAMLPRPGAWMDVMRRVLALPMFATALGLAWILGRQAGVDGMMLGLVAAVIVAIGLWWVGGRQAGGRTRAWWPLAPAVAAACALVAVVPRAPAGASTAVAVADVKAVPFDRAKLAAYQAAGTPVFVYFTADWCLTCKVNEKAAIEREAVQTAFAKAGIVTMVGDWTDGDADISRFLGEHGRSGVPLYLFAGKGAPLKVLPQVLTPGTLTALAA
ncbi:protein-disulfide reductase DsbD family protein [Sphingomonas prati]|uniref:DsbC/DsbD-like thiol-disulfide interchange protein/cytochrome c biogenesis protein CcdA n=1 Tax=Sphingomonas prati TaxID=1843237 RepID=A0A7W9F1X5_9SPHN|nr:DsbC/DsbD-like thiol-disulfide interchange protein/cytochrome c biogenesis protein CcdA [Sphingomonas prati]GGE90004.1 thio:disulfide interchange protein [Sphingomonas prati]